MWGLFFKNRECQLKIVAFFFEDFPSVTRYLRSQVQTVTYVRTEQDRHRQECHEDLLSMLREAVDLDARFLLTKGDAPFEDFLALLDDLFARAFSMRLRLEAVTTLVSLFQQLLAFPDGDLASRQLYERNKLEYHQPLQMEPSPA